MQGINAVQNLYSALLTETVGPSKIATFSEAISEVYVASYLLTDLSAGHCCHKINARQ